MDVHSFIGVGNLGPESGNNGMMGWDVWMCMSPVNVFIKIT